jgi:hypothetical protein
MLPVATLQTEQIGRALFAGFFRTRDAAVTSSSSSFLSFLVKPWRSWAVGFYDDDDERSSFYCSFEVPVEICITLGRMTGSPFSPVHPVPAK